MDFSSKITGSHAASKPKHISRLRKEMLQHRMHQHPFSSPPSSTGSHDTVSTTTEEFSRDLSDFSFGPDGEGTRVFRDGVQHPSKRHAARSGRFGSNQMHEAVLNTSAIARTFPEWSGLVAKDYATVTETVDMAAPHKPAADKENMHPGERPGENTSENAADAKRKRLRADLQARVENESDCSTVLTLSPARPLSSSRRSRFAGAQPHGAASPELPKRSLRDMVSKIRTEKQTDKRDTTPRRSPAAQPNHETPAHSLAVENSFITPTSRSFFLPAFRHLPDWTSGTLKFSTMKNGVPVFVKSDKSGVRLEQYGKDHAEIHAVGITKEDEEIFVSMDKLQEEVRELHDHDAMLQREAERLQLEVDRLQAELKRLKSRKLSDSAIGSESEASFRRSGGHDPELERQIAELRDRLDQASRQVGVNDIHSAALVAERDEALHQASVARERATKLQAELEATQKDLESSVHVLQEKETLQLENASLVAEVETLREQRDAALKNNKALTAENEKLRRELGGVQKDLRMAREELASVRKQCEALQEEKRHLAQDHASMERSNENYFKENKKLQAQVAARDQHIADLKKGIQSRDRMIDGMHGLTTDSAVLERNAELHSQIERLQSKAEQQAVELQQKDGVISAKEGRIRSLKEQNLDLSIDNERLREENQRLRTEHEEIRSQWVDERHKVVRLNQLLSKHKIVAENGGDDARPDGDLKQREAALQKKLDRREAAVRKVRRLSNKICEIAEHEFTTRTAKITRIVEPAKETQTTATDDVTGRSSAINVDDDPTRELNFDDSDFASVMEGEIVKLKQTYEDLQRRQQRETDGTEYSLPPLAPALQRSKSDSGALPSKGARGSATQLPGILKKPSQFAAEDTGRFSVKSALSIVSHHTEAEAEEVTDAESEFSRPASRVRRHSEADRDTTEPNMTSAFFIPDITLEADNDMQGSAQDLPQPPLPSLSKDARRVLDGICKHNSSNCHICIRIATYGENNPATAARSAPVPDQIPITSAEVKRGKKVVSAEKPIPVSDRASPEVSPRPHQQQHQHQQHSSKRRQQHQQQQEEDPTVRPSMPPGEALAILIKETRDEIEHLQMDLRGLTEAYLALDKARGMRERRRLAAAMRRAHAELEARSARLYRLHDVLEGQKAAGQLMRAEAVDVTVLSGLVLPGGERDRGEVAVAVAGGQGERGGGLGEGEWNGFD